ncbi:MAG: serine hydrolase domain-containing protein [Pyrinomonadaceae bacterium]
MKNNRLQNLFAFLLLFTFITASLPLSVGAQTGSAAVAPASQYTRALAEIESKVEARRNELGIPGMSLVIVKDDQIIYIKGLGYKDFEKKIVVTPDTQFAIGSATKAFTALSVLMSADEGKLSLEDSPKKALPYFKMYDPETDKNITIRDLLSHSSGLNRTDLAMVTGKLNRAELIQVAAQAKPTAKLREKFQYQNIMFAAAGEIVANVQKTPWEKFVPERIFKPLGMNNSTMSLKDMEKAKDYSLGYTYNFDTKVTEKQPFRDIGEVAPAGSINSSARDMAQWLRFVLNGGTVDGKRLVSEKGYEEWLKPQMKIAGTTSYGFGWFLQKWNNFDVVQHGGNIDGFNSLVAMIPEKKLGFAMLTNVSASSLGTDIMPMIFSNILQPASGENVKLPLRTMQFLAGKYGTAERNVEIKIEGEDMFIVVPGQPPYKLVRTAPRTFRAEGLPEGFGAKFTPETGDATELEMIQPQGNRKLPRLAGDAKPAAQPVTTAATKELVGKYAGPGGGVVEIAETDGKVAFSIPGQQPYVLSPKADGTFAMTPLPESYFITVRREGTKLTGVAVTQPEGTFEFKRLDPSAETKPTITVDELQKKTVDAIGGEANWRKFTTRVIEFDTDLENQGVHAIGKNYSKAPNMTAAETNFVALGKTIGTEWEFFDGTNGEDKVSFAPLDKYTGKRLEDVRLAADFYGPLNWRANYKKVEITGTAKVGDEEAYTVKFESEKGTPFIEYYSTKTFLLIKRTGVISSSTSDQSIPYTLLYSDYRDVDGIKLPFKTVNNNIANGNIVTTLRSVKHNVPLDTKLFGPKK